MSLPPGTRLLLVAEDFFEQWATRSLNGNAIRYAWGDPTPEGWYEPILTIAEDGLVLVRRDTGGILPDGTTNTPSLMAGPVQTNRGHT
jgi:hypothetical protein